MRKVSSGKWSSDSSPFAKKNLGQRADSRFSGPERNEPLLGDKYTPLSSHPSLPLRKSLHAPTAQLLRGFRTERTDEPSSLARYPVCLSVTPPQMPPLVNALVPDPLPNWCIQIDLRPTPPFIGRYKKTSYDWFLRPCENGSGLALVWAG